MWHHSPNTQLVEAGDTAFWKTRWKTDAFRALIDDPRTGYAAALEHVATRPWWLVDATQAYERRHFSVWFANTLINRTYANPFIEDLYYWHDLLHGLTFVQSAGVSENQWRLNMRANEISVSLETEVQIYWRKENLRIQSFEHPIWHDAIEVLTPSMRHRLIAYRAQVNTSLAERFVHERQLRTARVNFLPDPQSPTDRPAGIGLWDLRRAITLSPDPSSKEETGVVAYEATAEPFYDQWAPFWEEVEAERLIFERLCAQGQSRQAIARRQACWEKVSDDNGVPYGHLASALA